MTRWQIWTVSGVFVALLVFGWWAMTNADALHY
jgi:hypothetical protein